MNKGETDFSSFNITVTQYNFSDIIKCNVSFAGACWPEITAGSTFIQPCPSLLFITGGRLLKKKKD